MSQDEDTSSDEGRLQPVPRRPVRAKESLGNTSTPIASIFQAEIRPYSSDKVYRVRGIPSDYTAERTKRTLNTLLGLCKTDGSLKLGSLATSAYRCEKVATISFRETPLCLQKGAEWCFKLPDVSHRDIDDIDDPLPSSEIVIDTHFRDFTALRTFESESDHAIE